MCVCVFVCEFVRGELSGFDCTTYNVPYDTSNYSRPIFCLGLVKAARVMKH